MKSHDPPAVMGLRDVLWIAAAIVILCVAGCASGVTLTDEEQVTCRNEGCAAFTENEILNLMGGGIQGRLPQGLGGQQPAGG